MLPTIAPRYLAALDAFMRQIIGSQAHQPPDLGIMMGYALGWVDEQGQPYNRPTGKRIRPMLVLLCAEVAGGDWQKALPAAAAVEILHNFSLVHDDIQDNSLTRHNRPTVWKIWGQPNAINVGDALFTLSYRALGNLELPAEQVIKLWRIFNHTALELTRGQHLDMRFEHESVVTTTDYLSMIEGKSAALIAACAQIGALIGCNDERLAQHYARFGLNLGLAFQIRDDILGIWGDPTITGKSAATDILARKKSLPVLYGLSKSPTLSSIYNQKELTPEAVAEAVQALDSVGAQTYAQENETHFYQQALQSLEQAHPGGQAAQWLIQLVDNLFQRQY